ncbi:hypothetical protein [Nocardia sp. NPDC057030]|uniref:hypothetical protein n=1 Tax=unclassified Nocardia TaxID=2637762 RepID=UPI003633FD53
MKAIAVFSTNLADVDAAGFQDPRPDSNPPGGGDRAEVADLAHPSDVAFDLAPVRRPRRRGEDFPAAAMSFPDRPRPYW